MGNVIMKAQQIAYGASNVEKALDDLKAPELIELNKRMDAIDAWKANVHEETYTGSELTIDNALALPARSLITEINAIQDLHGYDHPWAGGAYKNKVNLVLSEIISWNDRGTWNGKVYSYNGCTFTVDVDAGTITKRGTATEQTQFFTNALSLPAESYKLSGCPSGGSYSTYDIRYTNDYIDLGNGASFVLASASSDVRLAMTIRSGNSDTVVYKPMITLASVSDSDYAHFAPYSNICPISGRTEARVERIGKNMLPMTVSAIKSANTTGTWNGNVYSIANGTIEILVDGSNYIKGFKVNGTFNSAVSFYVTPTNLSLESNGRIYSGITTGSDQTYFLYFDGAGVQVNTSEVTITTGRNPIRFARIVIRSGAVLNNVLFYPMMRDSSISDSTYEPYKGITATIQLGTTVYGADINWDTGVMRVDKKYLYVDGSDTSILSVINTQLQIAIDSDSYTTTSSTDTEFLICNRFNKINNASAISYGIYYRANGSHNLLVRNGYTEDQLLSTWVAFLTANPLQIVYKLATPTTIQLTPTQLEMLKGYNRVSVGGGYATIELKALVLGGDV